MPLPLEGTFTYRLPDALEVKPGSRVIVPFGKIKRHTGIVLATHQKKEVQFDPKPILDVLDDKPPVNDHQLNFFNWMARYYMSTLGEVINAALPAALKLSSESYISMNSMLDLGNVDVGMKEWQLLETLQKGDISIREAGEVMGLKNPHRIIKSLSEGGYIDLYEKIKDKYVPKKLKKLRIHADWIDEIQLEALLNKLETKPKQQEVILAYLREVPILEFPKSNVIGIGKSELLKDDISTSSLKTLIKNGILEEWEEVVARIPNKEHPLATTKIHLSNKQQKAVSDLKVSFQSGATTLLHGVTGSGKTEVYISLIQEQLSKGKQVLYLLPEIALTTQIISRLQRVFGSNSLGIYHSRYSDNERVEVWKKVMENEVSFVVGVRSAVFLPFNQLGLIIVDEEHEPSYKQHDPSPRYHARDSAIFLATLHKAQVVLGTATPSMETYKNVDDGKYGLVELLERYDGAYEPSISFINMIKAKKQKRLQGNFSTNLVDEIEKSLERKEQVIVFQNRRGYASYISCDNCGTVPKCPSCSVSLTYHQYNHKLVCHYCGFNQSMYSDCLHCGSTELRQIGFGTEELEEELKLLFPSAIIQRMDLDTTRSKYSYHRIIEAFEEGEIDILVGTQMISKGLDFGRVNLVGILDSDRLIHFPNFRSHERAYQLITQVSGRSGRKSKEGQVLIQTNDPDQSLLHRIKNQDFSSFYRWELTEREHFHYPPFSRIITITFKHRDKHISFQAANFYFHEITKTMVNQKIVGPVEPLIGKIRNQYLHEITLKLDKHGINLPAIKEYLKAVEKMLKSMPAFKGVGVVFDVDPI